MNKEKTNPLSQQQEKIKRQTFLRQLNQIKHNPQGGEDQDSPPAAPIGQRTGCCWEQQTGSRKAGNVLHEHVIIARRGHVVRVRPTKHKHMSSVIFSFTPLSVFLNRKESPQKQQDRTGIVFLSQYNCPMRHCVQPAAIQKILSVSCQQQSAVRH